MFESYNKANAEKYETSQFFFDDNFVIIIDQFLLKFEQNELFFIINNCIYIITKLL